MGACLVTPWISRWQKTASATNGNRPPHAVAPSGVPPLDETTSEWVREQRAILTTLRRHGARLAAAQRSIGLSTAQIVADAGRGIGSGVVVGAVGLFSSPAAAGVPPLLHAMASAYAGMNVQLPSLSSSPASSRELFDLSSIAEYYGERVPGGVSYLVNYLPTTVMSEEQLSACFLGQLRPGESWPAPTSGAADAAAASILHRPVDCAEASRCGIAVISALVLERLVVRHADAVAATSHSVGTFARRTAEAILKASLPTSTDARVNVQPRWPLVLVITDIDAWVVEHNIVDDYRLLWWVEEDAASCSIASLNTVGSEQSQRHPLAHLRRMAKSTFGISNDDHLFFIGWLGHGAHSEPLSWGDASDPRVYQLRRLLQTTSRLVADFERQRVGCGGGTALP